VLLYFFPYIKVPIFVQIAAVQFVAFYQPKHRMSDYNAVYYYSTFFGGCQYLFSIFYKKYLFICFFGIYFSRSFLLTLAIMCDIILKGKKLILQKGMKL